MSRSATGSPNERALAVLDLAEFRRSGAAQRDFLATLRRVLHEDGFFYLIGHGVDPDLIAAVLSTAKRFFRLPMEHKLAIEMIRSPHFRGYTRAGFERTRGEADWREQLDINSEGAPFPITDGIPAWRRLQGPNQWPEALPELRPLLLDYQAAVTRVGIALLEAIALSLGSPQTTFADIYEPNPSQLLKIIRYPGRDVTQSEQGVGAHRDGGFVTVLLQDEVSGLRVRGGDAEWIAVPPIPGTFVINAGELLELATNGVVRAALHAVDAPPPGIERFSVAFFLGSRPDAIVPVIDLPDDLRQAARGISADPLNPIFREVGLNQLKSRLRSHPDVAQIHHADLLSLIENHVEETKR